MIYDVSFGIVDVNSTDVRIFVTVDGKTLFDETITDATLHGASGYFGAIAPAGGVQVTLNDLSGNDKHYNKTTELLLDTLIADTANWTDFSWAGFKTAPTFGDGTVSIAGTTETAYALAGYKKEKYRNTEFQLKYTQTTGEGNDYGAIIWSFENSVTNLPWNSGGVMIAFENGKATLYARGDAGLIAKTTSGLTLDNGKTYDISLSVCQIAANQLRVIVKVDGAEWFNEVYTDAMLANTAGYFNVGACRDASATIEKTGKVVVPEPDPEPGYKVVDVTDMLADTSNWTTGWNKALTFENGSVTADGDLGSTYSVGGYNGKTYKNTIFRFKYTRTRYADDGYDGFTLGSGPDNVYWGAGGIYVDFNKESAVLRCIGKDKQAVFVTSEVPSLNDGQSYNIEFGIIDVNESTVKVLLKINDKTYFEKELTSSDFVGEEFYFGIIAVKSKATISKPDAK